MYFEVSGVEFVFNLFESERHSFVFWMKNVKYH